MMVYAENILKLILISAGSDGIMLTHKNLLYFYLLELSVNTELKIQYHLKYLNKKYIIGINPTKHQLIC